MTNKIVYCIDPGMSGIVPTLTKNKGYEVLEERHPKHQHAMYVIINDHGNKEEYYQYRFTTENPNKKMTKPASLPVSPAFIIEAHKSACSTWRRKLENRYPELFQPTQTFKTGDKVKFPGSCATYILANTGIRKMGLINIEDGGRWYELVEVKNSQYITLEEMKLICYGQPLDTVLINGATIAKTVEPTVEKTLTASVTDIEDAFKAAAGMPLQKKIRDYFPEAFGPELFDMYKEGKGKITEVNDQNVFYGLGAGPDEFHGKCLMVDQAYGAKPEITEHRGLSGTYWVVTFPKK